MTEYGKHGKPNSRLSTLPHSLEIPSGLPHSHGLDDEFRWLEATEKATSKPDLDCSYIRRVAQVRHVSDLLASSELGG